MNLDNHNDFKQVMRAAVNLGIFHVETGTRRVKVNTLIKILTCDAGGVLNYRNFHREILNRAYGLAFINSEKMREVRKRKAAEAPRVV
jgi:hypothetical protein